MFNKQIHLPFVDILLAILAVIVTSPNDNL